MKRVVAIGALAAALVLAGVGRGGSTSAGGHGILLLGHDPDAARIFLWRPGSPVKPLTGPQRWGTSGGGGFFSGMTDGFWSPNRRSIAFEQDSPDGLAPPSPNIVLMRSDGTHAKPLSSSYDYDPDDFAAAPSWAPNGHQLVYARQPFVDGETLVPQVFAIVDVPSGDERTWPVESATSEPVWGKPGIAYFSHSGIRVLNPKTGKSRLVTGRFRSGTLAWSPGGVLAVGERRRIVLLAASGLQVGKLPLPRQIKQVCAIAWIPNGKQILVGTRKTWDEIAGLWVGTVGTKHWQSLSPVPTWRNYKYDCAVSWR